MRQLIIARKDLNMSPGKLAAQVSHASMAFLTHLIMESAAAVWKYQTFPAAEIDKITGERKACLYRRIDLCMFAIQAFNEGNNFFTCRPTDPDKPLGELELCENEVSGYSAKIRFDKETYEDWINGIFTKTICEAKNRNQLLKAAKIAEEMGLKEGTDFFLIRDNCLTELEPEEYDENGVGRTLTCIGFRPLPDSIAHQISKKYQLYK
ncbi:MAG: peptidyl-tRNA hydrolase [Anaerolineaceae bacterium]|nr:peptidyl-tRNA hydrolase [Anaerolineaceae bacterium]